MNKIIMQSIIPFSLAPNSLDWLANSHHPRILHIFDRACNLINERGEVLSIVTPQIGNGPFNLVIEDDICFSEHLSLQSSVSISSTQLTLGHLTINTQYTTFWSPRPDWERLHARRNNILNQLKQLRITNYREASLWDQSLVSNLPLAIVNEDISAIQKIVSQLAGLGVGLTPSGDDLMMGAMYATWIIHPSESARVIAKEIADHAAPLTTSLSAAWLRSAGRGEAGIRWHDFFNALITGEDFQLPLTELLSVGETSGADALAGFFSVINTWAGKENCEGEACRCI